MHRIRELKVADSPIIETSGLRKSYPDTEALQGLDLSVPAGCICGFLGRNGAGKTTTLKILLGMTRPSGGLARAHGRDAGDRAASLQIRARTAFVSEEKDLCGYMTVGEMIRFTASFYPLWNAEAEQRYLRRFNLSPGSTVKTLSRGARSMLALLLALCRRAPLVILDEPTAGLDPAATEDALQAVVSHAAKDGTTVFFSSHQITEIEQIADHVAIIDRGRTVVQGMLDELLEQHRRIQLVFASEAPVPTFRTPGVRCTRREGRVLTLVSSLSADEALNEARALNPVSVDVAPMSVKEIFLESVNTEN
jgi:ABC-2 type transport system ATP-binding protein